jgi:hypothetical protein
MRAGAFVESSSTVALVAGTPLLKLYEDFNLMIYDNTVECEIEGKHRLRSAGFGVWQA